MRSMVMMVPVLSGYGGVLRVRVSLPLIEALLDEPGGKYMLPEDVPPATTTGSSEGRRRQASAGPPSESDARRACAGC
jgi:hypothetical protein